MCRLTNNSEKVVGMSNFYYLFNYGLKSESSEALQNGSSSVQSSEQQDVLFALGKDGVNSEGFSNSSMTMDYDSVLNSVGADGVSSYYQSYVDKLIADLTVLKTATVSDAQILSVQKDLEAKQQALKSLDDSVFGAVGEEKTVVTSSVSEYTYNASQIDAQGKADLVGMINSLGVVSPKVVDAIIESIGEVKVSTTKSSTEDGVDAQVLDSIKSQIEERIFSFYQAAEANGGYKTASGEFISADEILPKAFTQYGVSEDVSYLNGTQQEILNNVVSHSYNLETNFSALRNAIEEMTQDWQDVGQDVANIDFSSYLSIAKATLNEIKQEGVDSAAYDKLEATLKDFEEKTKSEDTDRMTFAIMMGDLSYQSYSLDMDTITYTDMLNFSKKSGKLYTTRDQVAELMPDFVTMKDGTKAIVDDEVIDFTYAQLLTINCKSKEEVENLINNDPSIINKSNLADKLWNDLLATMVNEKKFEYVQSVANALVSDGISSDNITKEVKEVTKEIPQVTSKSVDKAYLASKQASFQLVDINYIRDSVKNAYLNSHGPNCSCWVHSPVTRTKVFEMADAVQNSILQYQKDDGNFLVDTPMSVSVESFIKDAISAGGMQSACGTSKEGIIDDYLFNPDKYDFGSQFQNVEYKGALELRQMKNSEDTNSLAYQMKDFLLTNVNKTNENLFSDDVAQYLTEVSIAILENYNIDESAKGMSQEEYFTSRLNGYLNPDDKQGSVFYENFGAVLDFSKDTGIANQIVGSDIFNQLASKMQEYSKLEKEISEKSAALNVVQTSSNDAYTKALNQLAQIQEIASTYNLDIDLSLMDDSLLKTGSANETSIIDNLASYFGKLYTGFSSKFIQAPEAKTVSDAEPVDYSSIDIETVKKEGVQKTDSFDLFELALKSLPAVEEAPKTDEAAEKTVIVDKSDDSATTQASSSSSYSMRTFFSTISESKDDSVKTAIVPKIDKSESKEEKAPSFVANKLDFATLFNFKGFGAQESTASAEEKDLESILDSISWELDMSSSLSFTDRYKTLNGIDANSDQDVIERTIRNRLEKLDIDS